MDLLIYALVGGMLYGIFFSMAALGLNLVFGVMRIINLAHGQFMMAGGFGAWLLATHFGLNPLAGIALACAAAVVIGYPLYYAVVPRLLKGRNPPMLSFILFFGIAQVIEAIVSLVFGADQRSLPDDAFGDGGLTLFGQTFPASWGVAAAVSIVMLAGIYLYLSHTRLGYATRALMASRDEALTTGINVDRVSAIAFVIGLASAGIAGVFIPYMLGSLTPGIGEDLTTTSFAIVIVGSLGNPLGTVVGGLVFGLGTMLMQTYLSSWSNLVPYALLILIVTLRPAGLLGRSVRHA